MIFSEDRIPLFGIMLQGTFGDYGITAAAPSP
jgi:hypothetical protein